MTLAWVSQKLTLVESCLSDCLLCWRKYSTEKTASKVALALRLMIWMYLCVRKKEKKSLIIWGNFINEFEHLVWTAVPDGNCFIILKKGDWSPVWILFVGPRLNTKILAAVPVLACRTWQKMNYPISHINDVNSYCLLIRLTSNISKKCQFFFNLISVPERYFFNLSVLLASREKREWK